MTTNTPEQAPFLKGVATSLAFGEANIIITADDAPSLKAFLSNYGIPHESELRRVAMIVGPFTELPSIADVTASGRGLAVAKDFALALENSEFGIEITQNQMAYCKQSGLVVVFGASTDLAEFRGAITDEAGMGDIALTESGKILSEKSLNALDTLLDDGTIAKRPALRLIVHTFGEDGHRFATDIPHAEFNIVEDGETFGKGIVFHISDLKN